MGRIAVSNTRTQGASHAFRKSSRLLALADREFRELTNKPPTIEPRRKSKALKLNATRFDNT
jgi:hypothetical protein